MSSQFLTQLSNSSPSSESLPGLLEEGIIEIIKANVTSPMAKAAISLASGLGLAYQEARKAEIEAEGKKYFAWDTDLDDDERPCTVYLASREILNGTANHQALMFNFEDGRFLTYEANDMNGILTPYWYEGVPPGNHNWCKEEITHKKLSPKKINGCAKNNRFNGKKYSLTVVNCQVWVQQLGKELDISLKVFAQHLNNHCPRIAGGVNLAYDLLKYFQNPDSAGGSSANIGSQISNKMSNPSNIEKLFNDPEKFMSTLKT